MPKIRVGYYVLPLLYLAIGSTVTAMLVQRILSYANTVWLVLLIPMSMVTVFLTVVGIVNVWLSYRMSQEQALLRQYSQRSLLCLYLRCWGVVMAGLVLGVLYAWMSQLMPEYMQSLLADLSLLFYVMCALLTLAALMSIVLGENLQEIRLRNTQTENQLLKSQLNPHFLYNTLNNIDALIWLDQERASSAVTSLSDLMRYMTYSSRQESVALSAEVKAIRQLCSLQALRMPCADAIELVADTPAKSSSELAAGTPSASSSELMIAPLLLIPLVENCFKHCGPINQPRSICIRIEANGKALVFTTDNSLPSPLPSVEREGRTYVTPHDDKQTTGHGVGLSVLRRRLELLYPGHYSLSVGAEGERFRTKLTISY